MSLPIGKGQVRASGDDPLALPKGKFQERVCGDNPLVHPKGKFQVRASGDNPLALSKRSRKGQEKSSGREGGTRLIES